MIEKIKHLAIRNLQTSLAPSIPHVINPPPPAKIHTVRQKDMTPKENEISQFQKLAASLQLPESISQMFKTMFEKCEMMVQQIADQQKQIQQLMKSQANSQSKPQINELLSETEFPNLQKSSVQPKPPKVTKPAGVSSIPKKSQKMPSKKTTLFKVTNAAQLRTFRETVVTTEQMDIELKSNKRRREIGDHESSTQQELRESNNSPTTVSK